MNNNLSLIQTRGKEIFGDHFCIYPEDHELVQKLLTWFLPDEQQAKYFNINLHKGILLTGTILLLEPKMIYYVMLIKTVSLLGIKVVGRCVMVIINRKGTKYRL